MKDMSLWRRGGGRAGAVAVAVATLAAAGAGAFNVASASAATVDTSAWYVLGNRNSGKVLDVSGGSTANGAQIQQWSRTNGTNQQWQFVDSGGGFFRLRSK